MPVLDVSICVCKGERHRGERERAREIDYVPVLHGSFEGSVSIPMLFIKCFLFLHSKRFDVAFLSIKNPAGLLIKTLPASSINPTPFQLDSIKAKEKVWRPAHK